MPESPPRATDPPDLSALDSSLVRGIVWTGGAKWATQIVAWATTLIVARILTPEDYGLVSMATTYLGLITIISEFGIGTAVLALRKLSDAQLRQINTLSLLFGVVSFAVSAVVAEPIGRFFAAPQLPAVIMALSLSFVIAALRTVPTAVMQRELRFKRLAVIDAIRGFATALGSLAFALLGFRYWTLVAAALLGNLLATTFTVSSRPYRFAGPRLHELRESLTFSAHTIIGRVAWYVYSNADFLIAGRMLGKAALGAYSFGWQLATLPLEKVGTLVMQVTPAIFSAAQTDIAALRRYVLVISQALALATFPAVIGLALIAPELVLLVLGEKWRAMIFPLQILSGFATVRAMAPLLSQVLMVTGDQRYVMYLNVGAAITHPVAFWIGTRWAGVAGLAWAWVLIYPVVMFAPLLRRVFFRLELTGRRYLDALQPALVSTIVMTLSVIGTRSALPGDVPRPVVLVLLAAVGAVAYAATLVTVYRGRLRSFRKAWSALRRPAPSPPVA